LQLDWLVSGTVNYFLCRKFCLHTVLLPFVSPHLLDVSIFASVAKPGS